MTMDRRLLRKSVPRVLVILMATLALGCGAAGSIDDSESAAILVINQISQTSDPFGDVLTSGGTIPEDTIEVEFAAHLKAPTGPPGTATEPTLQSIVIDSYQVEFTRTDGGPQAPSGFRRGMSLRVVITETGQTTLNTSTASITLVPSTTKAQVPISFLIDPGFEPDTGFVNIQANARITFFGRTLAGDRVTATADVGINFANFGDDNS